MTDAQHGPDLKDYVDIVLSRFWSSLLIVLVVVGVDFYFTAQQTPVYTSSAWVLVKPIQTGTGNTAPTTPLNMSTETLVAGSPDVAREAVKEGNLKNTNDLLSGLSVSNQTNTEILTFTYQAPNASQAQDRANALAKAYIAFRHDSAEDQLKAQADAARAQLAAVDKRIKKVQNQMAGTSDTSQTSALQSELNSLTASASSLQSAITQDLTTTNLDVGQVVRPAQLPASPSSPSYQKNLAIGLLVGIALAIGTAFIRERVDRRIRNRRQLEAAIGAPVLAIVPNIPSWRRRKVPLLVTSERPTSQAAEAYRTLRTAVLFAASQTRAATHGRGQVIAVTSARDGEGKSVTTANLALALAQAGKRVVAISGDLRKPRLSHFLVDQVPSHGLADLLADKRSVKGSLMGTSEPNLKLLPSGRPPGRPAELLGSGRMREVLEELRERADFILIDTAPVLVTADPLELSRHVDAILFVTDGNRTTSAMVADARDRLSNVQAVLVGSILNNVKSTRTRGYQSYYSARYERSSREQPRIAEVVQRSEQLRSTNPER